MRLTAKCQCTSCNGPGFDPSIRRHSGIRGAADDAVLKYNTKKNPKKVSTEVVPGGAVQLPGLLLQLLHVPPQHVQPEHHCMASENEKNKRKEAKKYSLHFLTDYLRFSQTKHLPHPSKKSLLFPIKTDFNREEDLQIIF